MCGITTGGQAECYFDCEILAATDASTSGQIITNLECLDDCFDNQIISNRQQTMRCFDSLISDVLDVGICYSANFTSPAYPECLDTDSCPANFEGIYKISSDCTEAGNFCGIDQGTCSAETEELLSKQECVLELFEQQGFIQNTVMQLIQNSCSFKVSDIYTSFQQEANGFPPLDPCDPDYEYPDDLMEGLNRSNNRLAPAQSVLQFPDFTLNTQLNFENTRHRYPWVCSLRSTGARPEHLCAVTLLSVPPKPTVVVGAAHCTYICKNDNEKAIPVCCCADGVEDCSDDENKCSGTPKVYEMTGDDVEILCGEWETGDTPQVLSDEKYNVLLPIKVIVRHPNFNTSTGAGPIGGSDIAIFKVDDSSIQNKVSSLRLNPICLPNKDKQKPGKQTGIHAGWSKPPPFHFIEDQAQGYLPFYRDFFKQWHYKMDILPKCQDPQLDGVAALELQFPSNTFYPPGTVCANDFSAQSCFSTGDSGSPLMVTEKTRPMRFYAEGILSFVKGCNVFTFGAIDVNETKWQLNQQSQNPSTYTKLSCFLPWVAAQYDLDYKFDGSTDPACVESQGDPLDEEKNDCTITPSTLIDLFDDRPRPCIFPFHYNNKTFTECSLFDESGFVYPVFRCPSREITTKKNGINSYPTIGLTEGLCLTDPNNPNSPLDADPEAICNPFARRPVFQQCKNNCPGVRAFGVIGGGAALAFAGALSGVQLLGPAAAGLGAVGIAGVGGNAVAEMMCVTPYCRARSGQCCLITPTLTNLLGCPDSCPDNCT
jgi:hypothetical protein